MNAFRFFDIEFQHRAIDISKMRSDAYDPKVAGEAQASRFLLELVRTFYKWYAVPKLIVKFWATKIGLIEESISPLIPKAAPPLGAVSGLAGSQKGLTVVPPEGNPANEQGSSSPTA